MRKPPPSSSQIPSPVMGSACTKRDKFDEDIPGTETMPSPVEESGQVNAGYKETEFQSPQCNGVAHGSKVKSPIELWEERQKQLNVAVLAKLREDFHYRPDNFILNLLIVSFQFYKNYSKEKIEITTNTCNREASLSRKLTSSKRRILFQGGFEEQAGQHVLYQPLGEEYMEVPTPLQVFVVQDNVEIYPESQFDDLQQMNYSEIDGPAYRFCAEFAKRHPGYVRLRCVDIIPGAMRNNTYEDIYVIMPIPDSDGPYPYTDKRPLRSSFNLSYENGDGDGKEDANKTHMHQIEEEITPPPPEVLNVRRSSGLMPFNYPTRNILDDLKASSGNSIPAKGNKKIDEGTKTTAKASTSKAPEDDTSTSQSGKSFLNINYNHEFIRAKRPPRILPDDPKLLMVYRYLSGIEEDEENEEEEVNIGTNKEEEVNIGTNKEEDVNIVTNKEETYPDNLLKSGEHHLEHEKEKEEKEEVVNENKAMNNNYDTTSSKTSVQLTATIPRDCFLDRKIKLRNAADVYGIEASFERRTYFSSEYYMRNFELDFPGLAEILGKEHLVDLCEVQTPAILTHDINTAENGPKFNTEFIPTICMKEWPLSAIGWSWRKRRTLKDTETKTLYRWPPQDRIFEILHHGCNLVPIGHYNPKEPSKLMKIEWQLQFIAAEKILLQSLGHVQIRLLLLVEALFFDHLRTVPGLKTQHLRYILFWMCEHNFRDWTEEHLGIKLKEYLDALYESLSSLELPHYFVEDCNMLDTIPEKYLRQVQSTVQKMRLNLPIYLMHTLHQMRTEGVYYPKLDILKLYNIVTKKDFGVQDINPQLLAMTGGVEAGEGNAMNQPNDTGEDVLYSSSDEEERNYNQLRRKLDVERRRRKRVANEARDVLVDLRWKPPKSDIKLESKVQNVKGIRSGKVLEIFANHFIEMAKSSNEFRSYPQGYMYLLLASNMATLMKETGHHDESSSYQKEVEELNIASRGGVRDMLGSSYTINENSDLSLGQPRHNGSNWELKKEKQPLPRPPPDTSPITGTIFPKMPPWASKQNDTLMHSAYQLSPTDDVSLNYHIFDSKPQTQSNSLPSHDDTLNDNGESTHL
ncbi:uncharacterized protein LOC143040632 isoform X2 [Oratosquilla oratoria]|uniref:uncharacterized protein LOC143040632 isoform X2 n=1 Tax=Oratosquilla oratoria TaxID=337810 RepID=UPI003F767A4C